MITILKAAMSVILLCLKIVYRILKLLRIRILALYLAVCGIVQLAFHAFDGRIALFWAGFAVCAFLTLVSWVLHVRKRIRGSRLVRTKRDTGEAEEEAKEEPAPEKKREKKHEKKEKKPSAERPKYYDVAGKPDYVFAEFGDRYELYRKDEGGLTLVRTDYKNNERSNS